MNGTSLRVRRWLRRGPDSRAGPHFILLSCYQTIDYLFFVLFLVSARFRSWPGVILSWCICVGYPRPLMTDIHLRIPFTFHRNYSQSKQTSEKARITAQILTPGSIWQVYFQAHFTLPGTSNIPDDLYSRSCRRVYEFGHDIQAPTPFLYHIDCFSTRIECIQILFYHTTRANMTPDPMTSVRLKSWNQLMSTRHPF